MTGMHQISAIAESTASEASVGGSPLTRDGDVPRAASSTTGGGITMLNRLTGLHIAETSTELGDSTSLLRWSLVVIFLWFGGMKFTGYEAEGIAPFIIHSPIMSWLDVLFGVRGASRIIGVVELLTAGALAAGAFHPIASALGAGMSCAAFIVTLSFFFTTPGVAEPSAGGFPAISAPIGQFLLKDLVLLAASLCLLRAAVLRTAIGVRSS